MLMDPRRSQQHASLYHAVLQLQQEVTRPKARFKPTLPKKSGADGGANQVPANLVSHLTCTLHGVLKFLLKLFWKNKKDWLISFK